jgi:PPOX class probable FMN-dependent enzyme
MTGRDPCIIQGFWPEPETGVTTIETLEQLAALYGEAGAISRTKEVHQLTPEYRRWIESAPFVALATSGPGGLDCSPRGDRAGELLHVLDSKTLAVPDRRGNNRLDTLRNIVVDSRVALLFLIPGIDETLRINGRAVVSTDPPLIARFTKDGKSPRTVIVVSIESVYFQCARALKRAALWACTEHRDLSHVPTAGEMIKAIDLLFEADAYDAALSERQSSTLY